MYEIVIRRQAKKRLQGLPQPEKVRIAEQIHRLGVNPYDALLDVKRLRGERGFRLRVGQWRVIFDKDDFLMIIAIEKIGARGDVYK